MLGKKRKQRAEEISEKRLTAEQQFSAAIQEAGQTEDPVDRIKALKALHDNIGSHLRDDQSRINGQAEKAGSNASLGGVMASTATGAAGAFLLATGPVGWAIYGTGLAGIVGGSHAVGALRKRSKAKKLTREAVPYTERIKGLQASIMALIGETVENNVAAISKSSSYASILKIPGMADKFSAAAAKHIAEAPAVKEVPVTEKKKEPTLTKRLKP